ncbi:MAG: hypothetical protein U1F35_21030 [Steroidobacteraceae bacterium]
MEAFLELGDHLDVLLPPAAWVLKRELMWLPFVGWGLAALRPSPSTAVPAVPPSTR